MKIISFAWTTDALIAGEKTVTRRDWNDAYARRFKAGEIISAYDKNPRAGGKKIAEIRLTRAPYRQWLHDVTDEDEVKEGGLWGSGQAYREMMGDDRQVWVVEFELLKEGGRG
jgi:uncharacterized protein YqfB (UPF0267 family)